MYDFSFLKGSIETIILNALYSGDKYGYEIAREIKEKTENKYEIKQPTLYGYLKRLEQSNLILSYWGGGDSNGGRRRYYTLTDAGKKVCIDYMSEWNFQRDIIDSLVAKTDDENTLKEISQADATSILGSKSKRTHKKREIVSNNDLEELNKQLTSLKDIVSETPTISPDESTVNVESSIQQTQQNELAKNINQPVIQPQVIHTPNVPRYEVAPDPYRPDATIITPYTPKPQIKEETTQENKTEEKESQQTEPEKLSINEQLKNMAPAGPQLIFAPSAPSSPIITASSFEKPKQPETKPITPQPRPINNSPIITNSMFLGNQPQTPPTEQKPIQQKAPQKEFNEEKQYKQILGNLLENQLDEMSKTTFNTPEKYDTAINNTATTNSTPTSINSVIKDLEKNGIKSTLFNKQLANSYTSKEMIFTNRTTCFLSCMLAFSLILEYILLFTIFKSAVPDLKFTIFTILIILTCLPAGGFVLNYILHPTKKAEKKFNFKFNFVNSWILVGSILTILAIIYFVIIGVGDLKQFLLDFILPFVISLNVPLGVVYYNLILKFS